MNTQDNEYSNPLVSSYEEDTEENSEGYGLWYDQKPSRSSKRDKQSKRSTKKSNYDQKFSKLDYYN